MPQHISGQILNPEIPLPHPTDPVYGGQYILVFTPPSPPPPLLVSLESNSLNFKMANIRDAFLKNTYSIVMFL